MTISISKGTFMSKTHAQVNQGSQGLNLNTKQIKSVQFLKAFYLGTQSFDKLDIVRNDCQITETNNQIIIIKMGVTYKVPLAICFIEYQ